MIRVAIFPLREPSNGGDIALKTSSYPGGNYRQFHAWTGGIRIAAGAMRDRSKSRDRGSEVLLYQGVPRRGEGA
jgi:hypothetical protein